MGPGSGGDARASGGGAGAGKTWGPGPVAPLQPLGGPREAPRVGSPNLPALSAAGALGAAQGCGAGPRPWGLRGDSRPAEARFGAVVTLEFGEVSEFCFLNGGLNLRFFSWTFGSNVVTVWLSAF